MYGPFRQFYVMFCGAGFSPLDGSTAVARAFGVSSSALPSESAPCNLIRDREGVYDAEVHRCWTCWSTSTWPPCAWHAPISNESCFHLGRRGETPQVTHRKENLGSACPTIG